MANKLWSEGLDRLMGHANVLTHWRQQFSLKSNVMERTIDLDKMAKKCGIWGCLLGGVLASKIAQYVERFLIIRDRDSII
jgi:hypothetical protein